MPAVLPEDLAQFDWVARSSRPLIVCDVDEVVLEFVTPFIAYLDHKGLELRPSSFRLHGNVYRRDDGTPVSDRDISASIEAFFVEQHDWQTPVASAAETLAALKRHADIVFLTAMPPRHFAVRRALLDAHDMSYPMIATEDEKGTVLHLIHGDRDTKVVFIDDIFHNLHSVRDRLPNAFLINLMANDTFRALAPHPGEKVAMAKDWNETRDLILEFLEN